MTTRGLVAAVIILMFFIAVMPVGTAIVDSHYVSTTGSDNGYGTLSSPYRTISKAVSKATSGDTICLRGGTYREKVTITKQSITIKPYNTEKVIVSGSGLGHGYDGIFMFRDGCKNVRITGLELANTNGHGVFVYGSTVSNIKIDNCIIHNCQSSGIYVYNSNNIEFSYNTVYDVNNGRSYSTSSYSPQEAISFSRVNGFNIHHNTLSRYGKEGIDCKSGSSNGEIHHNTIDTSSTTTYNHIGIYIDSQTRKNYNINIYNNKITGYGGPGIVIGSEKIGGSLEGIYIYNNIIDLTYRTGYSQFRGIDSCYDRPMKNIYIYGNTITVRGYNHPIRIFPSAWNIINLVIKDNTLYGKASIPIFFQKLSTSQIANIVIMYNNIYHRI